MFYVMHYFHKIAVFCVIFLSLYCAQIVGYWPVKQPVKPDVYFMFLYHEKRRNLSIVGSKIKFITGADD